MTGFDKNWSNLSRASSGEKLKEALRPQSPLKPKIETAVNKLQLQTSKLDTMMTKLNERDASLFRRGVNDRQRHDAHTAKGLSNELANVGKAATQLGKGNSSLAA